MPTSSTPSSGPTKEALKTANLVDRGEACALLGGRQPEHQVEARQAVARPHEAREAFDRDQVPRVGDKRIECRDQRDHAAR